VIKLAIRGHKTRGKEVIEILEMLGGKMFPKSTGTDSFSNYYINHNGHILYYPYDHILSNLSYDCNDDVIEYTLEEFLKKYPYKLEDRVKNVYGDCGKVYEMKWIDDEIQYRLNFGHSISGWYGADELQPYKEETMGDKSDLLQQLKEYFDNTPRNIIEKEWHEYDKYNEIGPKVNEYLEYVNNIRLHKYPKNYKECCEVLMGKTDFQDYSLLLTKLSTKINEANSISPEPPHITLINNFYKLLICRDAYWKIAGEEMGLGKPWEPDWKDDNDKYFICYLKDELWMSNIRDCNRLLVFPTAEMRDAFYKAFKDLIEYCKELL
jgi:hypothetical protein